MKLLIDTKNQKVLFAEASKPVIDFLFNLLCLPIGTVVRFLNERGMVGSLGNLYQSVANLGDNYMVPNQGKDVLLKPKALISSSEIAGLLPTNDEAAKDIIGPSLFMCLSRCHYTVTYDSTSRCAYCSGTMNNGVSYVGKKVANDMGSSIKNGFVKEMIPYMVMDDLVIEPMSISNINILLSKSNGKDVGALQEKVVHLGMDEGIKILKASLQSKTVLTSVFVKNNFE
ncbi:uncharacterized protein LOC130720034 [Lotus japonicus]|uniref:uncharacterized protein LOC130720034 n=1 Tax=Lotus japonicus TaxID=34305 RepID=UPI002589BF63|nr:uncharacterized protein LOC130720034 [Lotus japonicus]